MFTLAKSFTTSLHPNFDFSKFPKEKKLAIVIPKPGNDPITGLQSFIQKSKN